MFIWQLEVILKDRNHKESHVLNKCGCRFCFMLKCVPIILFEIGSHTSMKHYIGSFFVCTKMVTSMENHPMSHAVVFTNSILSLLRAFCFLFPCLLEQLLQTLQCLSVTFSSVHLVSWQQQQAVPLGSRPKQLDREFDRGSFWVTASSNCMLHCA